jgi:hypothetical protein
MSSHTLTRPPSRVPSAPLVALLAVVTTLVLAAVLFAALVRGPTVRFQTPTTTVSTCAHFLRAQYGGPC